MSNQPLPAALSEVLACCDRLIADLAPKVKQMVLPVDTWPGLRDENWKTCKELYDKAVQVGAAPVLEAMTPPPAVNGARYRDVVQRATLLADWCRQRLDAQPPEPVVGTGDPHDDLRALARQVLKGIDRRVVELVCDGGGECSLADIARDPVIRWGETAWKTSWGGAQRRINRKLTAAGSVYQLSGDGSRARVLRIRSQAPEKADDLR